MQRQVSMYQIRKDGYELRAGNYERTKERS